jgi:signal transduction histidine kinase
MSAVVLVAVGALALLSSRSASTEFERYLQDDIQRDQQIVSDLLIHYEGDPSPERMQALVDRLANTSGERIIVAERGGVVIADSQGILVGEAIQLPLPAPNAIRDRRLIEAREGIISTMTLSGTQGLVVGGKMPVTGAVGVSSTFTMPIFQVQVPVTGAGIIPIAGGGPALTERISWSPLFVPLAMVPVSGTMGIHSNPTNLIVARVPATGGESSAGGYLNSVNQQLLFAAGAAGVVALLLTWLLSRRILGPVEALTVAAGKMERGDLSQKVEVDTGDEIGKLAHAFNAMSDSLARQETLRRNMASDIAHELRTPLSNIRGYLEAAQDGMVEPDAKLIASLHEESLLLSRLIEDLQELQLAEAGQLSMEPVSVDVGDLIDNAAHALKPAADARGVSILVEAEPDLPPVQADRERIGQVLRNLMDNAITHTPEGGEITVSARASADEIEVSVRDTGEGIPPEHLQNVFERFYRVDSSRARSTGGAGLGLAIVKQIVVLHGGRVWADSEVGVGSTFYFTLPLAKQL